MAITTILIPATINFSKNFIPVKFQSDSYLDGLGFEKENYRIYVELWVQNAANTTFELINTQNLPLIFASAGQAQTDLKDTLHAILEDAGPDYMDVADTSFLSVKKSVRKFYLKYAESVDGVVAALTQTVDFTVAYGGLSYQSSFSSNLLLAIQPDAGDATKDRFLRQGNGTQFTRTNQPQFLYFLNTRATANASLKAKFYFTDNSTPLILTPCSGSLTALSKFAFNVKFDQIITSVQLAGKTCQKYEVWLENTAAAKISETRTFFLDYQLKEYVRYFTYWNSWGAVNTLLTYGKASSKIEIIQSEAQRIRKAGDDIKKGDRLNFDISLNNDFSCATGFVSRREIAFNRDFYLSPFKFRYTGGKLLPISVTSKNIAEVNDGNGLYAQNFDYKYLFDDDCYTEGDLEDGVGIDGFFFNLNPANPTQGFSETDPTVPGWVKSISLADIANWNAGTGAGGTANWGQISGAIINQTDLINYLNGNFYSKSEINNYFGGVTSITGYNKTNWDNAFGWGNHAGIYKAISYTPSNAEVISALGFTPISGINNGMVISALGYTPYNASNPSQYINASSDAFIKNQNTFQSGAVLHVKGGNFAEYLTIPTVLSNDPGTNNKPQLYYDAAGLGGSAIPAVFNLGNLANVNVTGVADDDVMYYHALSNTYKFKAATFGGTPVDAYTKAETNNHFAGLVAITGYNKANWDNAFSYGNHAGLYSVLTHTHTYASLTSKPTTIAGHGITDFNSLGDARFQPLENQRLRTTDVVSFSSISSEGDFTISNNHSGNAATWYGRTGVRNAGNNRSVFLGTYSNNAVVGAHNNALNAWADLYINTVNGFDGGNVYLPSGVFLGGNAVVSNNGGTWGIGISGNAASATNWGGRSANLNVFQNGSDSSFLTVNPVGGGVNISNIGHVQGMLGLGSAAYQSDAKYFQYATFTADANTLAGNRSAFTYALGAPYVGPVAHFDASGYGLQLNANYGGGNAISFRTKNGDTGIWNTWKRLITTDEVSQGATGNTIAQRTVDGDISSRYSFSSYVNTTDNVETGGLTYLIGKFGDNYHRSATANKVQTFLGLGSNAYTSNAFASINGNTGVSFGAFEFSYTSTQFNPALAPRLGLNPMSVKMWNNYFNGTGLGSDYGTVMDYYSLGSHVNTQVYFDASGGSWYRTSPYNAGWQGWQQYITSANLNSFFGSAAFLNASQAATANSIVQRTVNGDIEAREVILNVGVQSFTPSSIVAIFPTTNQAVKVNASGVQAFLGMPTGGDTLQSVTNRGSTTSNNMLLEGNNKNFRINSTSGLYSYLQLTAGTFNSYFIQNANGNNANGVSSGATYIYMENGQNFEFSWLTVTKASINSLGNAAFAGTVTANGNISTSGNMLGFNVADNFVSSGTSIPYYGLGNIGGVATTLSGYYGVKLFTAGVERLHISLDGNANFSQLLKLNKASSGTHAYHELNRVGNTENMFVWQDSGIAKWYLGQRVINGGTGFQLYNVTQAANHVNFYASGNTAFGYSDAADNGHKLSVGGTGYFSNYIQTTRVVNTNAVSDNIEFGMYFNSSQTTDYAVFREAGGWGHPYPDLRIAFHTGIKIGGYFGYGGTRFYNNSDMATQLFSVGDGDQHVRVNNDLYVSGAITAPTIKATSSLQIPVKPGGVANGQTVELYYQP